MEKLSNTDCYNPAEIFADQILEMRILAEKYIMTLDASPITRKTEDDPMFAYHEAYHLSDGSKISCFLSGVHKHASVMHLSEKGFHIKTLL